MLHRQAPYAAEWAAEASAADSALCQACGACCAYSAEWPRFALEDDAALAAIPRAYVEDDAGRMRCEGDRCTALTGTVGVATNCAVYAVRPDVCRACLPGDDSCLTARRRFGLPTEANSLPAASRPRAQAPEDCRGRSQISSHSGHIR